MIPLPDTIETIQLGMFIIAVIHANWFRKGNPTNTNRIISSMWVIGAILYGEVAR